jgi:hypothetical protein
MHHLHIKISYFKTLMCQVCREVDAFFIRVALHVSSCKNIELGGQDGMKVFAYGITCYMLPKIRRINGGWWVSIARQLRIFLCCTDIVSAETRKKLSNALRLLLRVHPRTTQSRVKKRTTGYPSQDSCESFSVVPTSFLLRRARS